MSESNHSGGSARPDEAQSGEEMKKWFDEWSRAQGDIWMRYQAAAGRVVAHAIRDLLSTYRPEEDADALALEIHSMLGGSVHAWALPIESPFEVWLHAAGPSGTQWQLAGKVDFRPPHLTVYEQSGEQPAEDANNKPPRCPAEPDELGLGWSPGSRTSFFNYFAGELQQALSDQSQVRLPDPPRANTKPPMPRDKPNHEAHAETSTGGATASESCDWQTEIATALGDYPPFPGFVPAPADLMAEINWALGEVVACVAAYIIDIFEHGPVLPPDCISCPSPPSDYLREVATVIGSRVSDRRRTGTPAEAIAQMSLELADAVAFASHCMNNILAGSAWLALAKTESPESKTGPSRFSADLVEQAPDYGPWPFLAADEHRGDCPPEGSRR